MNKDKKELQNTLNEINLLLSKNNFKLELIIIGGAAFIIKGLVPRTTTDFDYINKVNEDINILLTSKGFDVNGRTGMFDYQFGPDYKGDLESIFETDNLSVQTISTERLMISRLFSNKRSDDFEFSVDKGVITKEKFEMVLEEVYSYAIHISKKDFVENTYMIKALYEKKGWDYESSNIRHLCEIKI